MRQSMTSGTTIACGGRSRQSPMLANSTRSSRTFVGGRDQWIFFRDRSTDQKGETKNDSPTAKPHAACKKSQVDGRAVDGSRDGAGLEVVVRLLRQSRESNGSQDLAEVVDRRAGSAGSWVAANRSGTCSRLSRVARQSFASLCRRGRRPDSRRPDSRRSDSRTCGCRRRSRRTPPRQSAIRRRRQSCLRLHRQSQARPWR